MPNVVRCLRIRLARHVDLDLKTSFADRKLAGRADLLIARGPNAAGSRLILARHDLAGWPADGQVVLQVLTTACWAMATFWIPLLAALFIEKHVIIGDPVRYTVAEWSVVFPLGMYSAATHAYADAAHLPFLVNVARITVLIAFATWILAAIGLLRSALRSVNGK